MWLFKKTRSCANLATDIRKITKYTTHFPDFWIHPYVLGFLYSFSRDYVLRACDGRITIDDVNDVTWRAISKASGGLAEAVLFQKFVFYLESKDYLLEQGIEEAKIINKFLNNPNKNFDDDDDTLIEFAKNEALITEKFVYGRFMNPIAVSYIEKVSETILQVTFLKTVFEIWKEYREDLEKTHQNTWRK